MESNLSVYNSYQGQLSLPAYPVEGHNQLDSNEVNRWIGAHPDSLKPALYELSQKVEHISYPTFDSNFKTGIHYLNGRIKKETIDDYMVMIENGKSNKWMAEIALTQLDKPPTQVYSLGKKGIQFKEYIKEQSQSEKPYYPSTVVFFDDGIYSGKQMSNFIKGIFDAIKEHNKETGEDEQISLPNVEIIAPYATEFGEKMLYTVNAEEKDLISLCDHERIKTLAEVLHPGTQVILDGTLWKKDPRDETRGFSTPYQRGVNSRGNIWFDHKIPNWLSFVHAMEFGIVTGEDGSPLNGTISRNEANEPIFHPLEGKRFSPIPKTIPPYKI
jgi:hypothetical protein